MHLALAIVYIHIYYQNLLLQLAFIFAYNKVEY